jgi:hypothetical protein
VVEANFCQLLQGIGALSKANCRKAFSRSGNYQDNAVVPLDREHDDEAVQLQDEEGDNDNADADGNPSTFLSAIAKVTLYHMCYHHIILRLLSSSFGRSSGMFGPAPNTAKCGTKKYTWQ